MRTSWLLLSLPGVLLNAPVCHGAPPTAQPAAVSEKDVVGDWCMGSWSDNEWVITIYPNHTLKAAFDGYGALGPVTTSWWLGGNQLYVDTRPLIKPFSLEIAGPAFSRPLTVSRCWNNVLLLPEANARLIQAHGPEPALCFWHYTVDKKGTQLPPEAAVLIKREQR